MLELNLPSYTFRFEKKDNKVYIFDIIRKRLINLTPEEWVRQHFIQFLVHEKGVPVSHIQYEGKITTVEKHKRFDAIAFNKHMYPSILMEFKAPHILLGNEVFEQINTYNLSINAAILIISNGIKHLVFSYDKNKKTTEKLELSTIPHYNEL